MPIMIVCSCHCVSDRDIEREARQGCASFEALQQELFVATACGACDGCARTIFEHACAGGSSTHPPHVRAAARPPAQPASPGARPQRRQTPVLALRVALGAAA